MGHHFSSQLRANLNLCLIYFETTWALTILLEHMQKKFEINRTKIKGGCQSGRKVVTHNSKSDLPLVDILFSDKYSYAIQMQAFQISPLVTYLLTYLQKMKIKFVKTSSVCLWVRYIPPIIVFGNQTLLTFSHLKKKPIL